MMPRFAQLSLFIATLACLGLLMTGCDTLDNAFGDNFFGKEGNARGSLPGKREDVFEADSTLKADAAAGEGTVEVPEATLQPEWPVAGGAVSHKAGNSTLAAQPAKLWSASIGTGSHQDAALIALPVVAKDTVFTAGSEGRVTAFATKDGTILWQVRLADAHGDRSGEYGTVAGTGLGVGGDKLVVTTSQGSVVALDTSTGATLWQRNFPSPISAPPSIAEDKVYVTATNNTVYELALADGQLGWSQSGIQETASLLGMANPLVTSDLVVVPYSSGEVFALRRLNGRQVWEENLASSKRGGTLPAMADIQALPVLDGDKIYVTSHSGRFVALDIHSGTRVFEVDLGSVQTPFVAGNSLFLTTTENQLAALSRTSGHTIWAVDLQHYADAGDHTTKVLWAGPIMAGGQLWLTNSLGQLKAYDPQNGKEKVSIDIGEPLFLPPIAADNKLYVLTDKGKLVVFQ